MVTELITEKSHYIRNWMWKQRFEKNFSSHAGLIGDGQQLHFLLGVKGGGVEHLGRLISLPGTKVRYFANVLSRMEPRLQFQGSGDRLSFPFEKSLERNHPLFRTYRLLVEYDNEWATGKTTNRIQGKNPEALPCLVMESHALLASEALLRETGGKAMLYVSDPVKVVDALFEDEKLDTPYREAEAKSVFSPYFLARFMRRDYAEVLHTLRRIGRSQRVRERIILTRVLTVALIQHMFRMLALRYPQQITLVDFAQVARDPYRLESAVESFLGDPGLAIARHIMSTATFHASGNERPLWKNAWPEQMSSPRYLTSKDMALCYSVLKDSGLGTGAAPDTSRYVPSSRRMA